MPDEQPEEKQVEKTHRLVDKANAAAQRLEEGLKKMEENLAKIEAANVARILDGKAEAGIPPEQKQEESPVQYVERLTGIKKK